MLLFVTIRWRTAEAVSPFTSMFGISDLDSNFLERHGQVIVLNQPGLSENIEGSKARRQGGFYSLYPLISLPNGT